jgi:hypothetical protein
MTKPGLIKVETAALCYASARAELLRVLDAALDTEQLAQVSLEAGADLVAVQHAAADQGEFFLRRAWLEAIMTNIDLRFNACLRPLPQGTKTRRKCTNYALPALEN